MIARCIAAAGLALLLSACGPDIGDLAKGEEGRVVRAFSGDTLELDNGMRVFLAEIDAPRRDQPYANQAQGDLESLALHREVRLAYGGTRRWIPRPRPGEAETEPPSETAIAHVYVKSEGGRWFWLQHELVQRGDAFVRARADNDARAARLLTIEAEARAAERGLWAEDEYRGMSPREAAAAALAHGERCQSGAFSFVEGRVADVYVGERRAALTMESEQPFEIALFGQAFAAWDGPSPATFDGERIRARGTLGVFNERPQLCIGHPSDLELID